MKHLNIALILLLSCFAQAQTIEEDLKKTLEQPDSVSIDLKVYAPHYYLDSLDQIQDFLEIREEIEWYMLQRIPELYPTHEISYRRCSPSSTRTESFLNVNGEELPVSFRYRIFEPNTTINTTDRPRLVVYYYHCFDAVRD